MNYADALNLKFDPAVLPLSDDRYPFRTLDPETFKSFLSVVERFPQSCGRMHVLLKRELSLLKPCPTKFVIKEAHIDVSRTDSALRNDILGLGFEPDHFLSLNPPEYRECYTLRMEFDPAERHLLASAHSYLSSALKHVQERISLTPGIFAYTELETYSDLSCRRFEFCEATESSLKAFPFASNQFRPMATDDPKVVDVHVKIPFSVAGRPQFVGADSAEMDRLRQLMLCAGFYEIRSLSGNAIYTIQALDPRLAKNAFKTLVAYASEYGGITFVGMESVNEFWRKEENIFGRSFVSPVPQVVAHA